VSDTQLGNGVDLEAGISAPAPVSIAPTHTPPTLLFMGMLRSLVAMIGRRLTCVLVCSLVIIPIVTAFARLVIMKFVTGHADYIALIVSHFVYTICTGVLTNMLTAHYADFITKVMYATMATVRELFAGILPETVETGMKKIDDNKDAVKSVISLAIKILMVILTVFITVLDSQNIAVIIVPCVNLFNILVIRRFTKKPEEGKTSLLPLTQKESMLSLKKYDGLCPYCKDICNDLCVIKRDFKKSIWTQTLLITITWIPDIICIWVFTYSDSTTAVVISYMYNSWLIRDAITYAFKVMDDEALPLDLFRQMLTIFSYLSKNQVSLRIDGEKLTKCVHALHVTNYQGPHDKFSCIIERGLTLFGGPNGSGKSELFRQLLIGLTSAFSVMHSKEILLLNKCTLASIRDTIQYYTAEMLLPVTRLQLYHMNPELAGKLGITLSMANLGRPSKGQQALFLIMWIIMVHGNDQGIVILDEVTANLDHVNRERVFSVIREYFKGICIIVDNSVSNDQLDVKLPAPSVPIPL
jgi:ABC-type lipoprotein export system ATPase subunit